MKLHWGGRCYSYGPTGTSSRANKSSWVWLAAVDSLTSWDVSCPAGASTWDSIHTNCAHAKKGHVHASVTGDEHNITWGQHSWEAETCNTSTITATSPSLLLASSVPSIHPKAHRGALSASYSTAREEEQAVPSPCTWCPGSGSVSVMGHIPHPHTCSCSSFQVTGVAVLDFSRLSHFWHLRSQTKTQRFPLSPSIWNPEL